MPSGGTDFDDALTIGNVGLPKLTQTLFLINPSEFMPYDDGTRKLFMGNDPGARNWEGYRTAVRPFPRSLPWLRTSRSQYLRLSFRCRGALARVRRLSGQHERLRRQRGSLGRVRQGKRGVDRWAGRRNRLGRLRRGWLASAGLSPAVTRTRGFDPRALRRARTGYRRRASERLPGRTVQGRTSGCNLGQPFGGGSGLRRPSEGIQPRPQHR